MSLGGGSAGRVNVTASLVLIVILALLFVLPEPGERTKIVRRTRQRR